MSENKADPLREALKPLAAISLWRDKYQDGPDMLTNDKLARYFTADQVRAARAALAAPQPAADQDLVDMLWAWFEDRGHDLREERTYGITSEEFRIMLDEHEANLLPDGHTPPQPAAPLSGREREAREECLRRGIDPDDICADGGVTAWMVVDQETREGGRHPIEILWREHDLPEWFLGNGGSNTKLYALYDAILAIPQERGVEREAELKQILSICEDNAPESCNHRMALEFVRQVVSRSLGKEAGR